MVSATLIDVTRQMAAGDLLVGRHSGAHVSCGAGRAAEP